MEEFNVIQKIAIWVIPVIFAITVHEAAHGWAAEKFGDTTARALGRITMNPIKHMDPVGTLLVPAITLLASGALMGSGIVFGWAKPVPVNWRALGNPRRDMALVALAGPASNVLMAVFWALLIHLAVYGRDLIGPLLTPIVFMSVAGILINGVLFVINMIPILPLDGGRVLSSVLPPRIAMKIQWMESYGIWIFLALLFTGILVPVVGPMIAMFAAVMAQISGLAINDFQLLILMLSR